ncbi:ABC transporter ATP-binding protein [Francisella tularensis subsp. holarctica PHIT-FT049]|uniref:ATP-binding cassette domain-containing protein n=1 Tax=Francisella tularensis TaxID=263 RepID=UPI0003E768D2|nr:ABC transporter ATP-binding protein [Francisella tularensis subsp. holarctica PHIT-FT049]
MIFFKNVSYQVEIKELFDNINFSIFPNQKIGLVGKNGTGKTTLFNLIKGNLTPDKGDIEIAKNTRIVTVKQEVDDFEVKVIDYVVNGIESLKQLKIKMQDSLASENFVDYSKYHEEYESLGGYTIESQAGKLLSGLGFSVSQLQQKVKELSGGWQIRLNLAQALLQESDILLLDEPTNHLDIGVREALTVALQSFQGAIILVSHDRFLLESTVDEYMLVGEGQVKPFDGDMKGYYKYILEVKKTQNDTSNIAGQINEDSKKQNRRLSADKRKQLKPLQDKIKKLERALEKLQQQDLQMQDALQDQSLYDDKEKLQQTLLEHSNLKGKIEEIELDWFVALEELESINQN